MKKLLAIIAITIIGVLAVSVVTLAFVKTDYNQAKISSEIEVYYGQETGIFKDDDNEEYADIYEKLKQLYVKGTKETVLSSLFQGAYSQDAKPEIKKSGWTFAKTDGKVYLKFIFNTEQVLSFNGKVYIDEAKTSTDKTIKYDAIWVEIINSNSLVKVNAYFRNTDSSGSTKSSYRIMFLTAHMDLYNYIVELSENDYLF